MGIVSVVCRESTRVSAFLSLIVLGVCPLFPAKASCQCLDPAYAALLRLEYAEPDETKVIEGLLEYSASSLPLERRAEYARRLTDALANHRKGEAAKIHDQVDLHPAAESQPEDIEQWIEFYCAALSSGVRPSDRLFARRYSIPEAHKRRERIFVGCMDHLVDHGAPLRPASPELAQQFAGTLVSEAPESIPGLATAIKFELASSLDRDDRSTATRLADMSLLAIGLLNQRAGEEELAAVMRLTGGPAAGSRILLVGTFPEVVSGCDDFLRALCLRHLEYVRAKSYGEVSYNDFGLTVTNIMKPLADRPWMQAYLVELVAEGPGAYYPYFPEVARLIDRSRIPKLSTEYWQVEGALGHLERVTAELEWARNTPKPASATSADPAPAPEPAPEQ
jgi:hypothetical protein